MVLIWSVHDLCHKNQLFASGIAKVEQNIYYLLRWYRISGFWPNNAAAACSCEYGAEVYFVVRPYQDIYTCSEIEANWMVYLDLEFSHCNIYGWHYSAFHGFTHVLKINYDNLRLIFKKHSTVNPCIYAY